MSAITDAAEDLLAAMEAVEGVRLYRDPGATVDPPGIVLGPPTMRWESSCLAPSSARFIVYVTERADERALERLWDLVPTVAEALDQLSKAAVLQAAPGTFTSGGVDLPAYLIEVEVSL
jgi:hypothetical protein